MSLKARITDDMKAAMRGRANPDEAQRAWETVRLGTIRLLLAAIRQKEIDERIELDDAAVSSIVEKLIKQRRDSISQFQAAGRDDLVAAEQAELAVLQAYLPEQLSIAEVEAAVAAAIAESGAASAKDMGKVMSLLKPRLAGRADMGQVSSLIKARLAG
ncbi:GatB/YqeY domain-containing protein [Thiobacillus denitrificans]|uniref:Glutamyl-tRNA amidotransferase n=1 Tax=Thiobacillus denitrificans TaxID=36861 RepID=A0A106BRH7_THIDE|nr:GatB/YqeY domain-containing protein [Thiobacillus denitrificans]KVW97287.1 glutamyl-tRNA amidotransferase [Thiobacillus denitrificans]